ncbi:hypothetical protein GCM10011575_02670 [Microlunatus endophyticus]|uniref:PspA-associated domain-containing protein n=1 Tax=Microlunatus endophyticus TaxID=1716077 RepID=A0A917VZA2_9ACTN|nr:hypothetical protein [Microlunatus endophyticus]GGL48310.1 hypothetical protein GCM10011575_02670 [Microlunatus endophyticus]
MIIRILGEGQFRIDDAAVAELNSTDDTIEKAVAAGDQEALTAALTELHARVLAEGEPVADDALEDSDLILPAADASVAEVRQLLEESQEGLLPG